MLRWRRHLALGLPILEANLLKISELFFSIQGESSFAGYPCVFIRLAGCNLRCSYCDAKYTYDKPGKEISITDIIQFTTKYPNSVIEITGGEPLLQEGSLTLMERLLASGRTVLLETNGSLDLTNVPIGVVRIVDLKCPDSEMHPHMLLENFTNLKPSDEIKCVISSRRDYDWAVEILTKHNLLYPLNRENMAKKCKILFSPVSGGIAIQDLAKWILQDELPVRLQNQLHKTIWPNCDRGV